MVIIEAKIHTMEGEDFSRGFLRTEGKKIGEIGDMAQYRPKEGEQVLDAGGTELYPGFVDAHSHIGMFEDGIGFEGEDGNEDTDPLTPHLRAVDAVNPMERSFEEALDGGVTTVVTGPGSANPIGGQLCAMKTQGCWMEEMVISPCVGVKFALGENPKSAYNAKAQTPSTRMATAALIREQLEKTRKYMEQLEDAEADEDCDEPEYDAKCEALIPLLKREVKAHFHAHRADDIFTAVRLAREFDLDYVLVHCTEGHLIAKQLSSLGAKVLVGPLIGTRSKPELRNAAMENPGILDKAGVMLGICTDHPEVPQQYLALSAALAAAEGLDRQRALEAITILPAKICGLEERVGSLKPGKDADFLLFDKNPFEVGAKPVHVFVEGQQVR